MRNKIILYAALASLMVSYTSFASKTISTIKPQHFYNAMTSVPQPTACIKGTFSKTGNKHWWNISLVLTNQCGKSIDMQNTTVTFTSADNLNTNVWGTFSPLSYPDNAMQLTSQSVLDGYLASLSLHFPEGPWSTTVLPNGSSITLKYGSPSAAYVASSVNVYINGMPVQTGEIGLSNITAKPAGISQAYAIVDITSGGQIINSIQVPWSGSASSSNLVPGTYTISPENLTDEQGNQYQGSASPSSLIVSTGQKVSSTISYSTVAKLGSIAIKTAAIPSQLVGYTKSPSVTFTRPDIGATVSYPIGWNTTTTVSQLAGGVLYNLSTPVIIYQGSRCEGSFDPASMFSDATKVPTTTLTYNCVSAPQDVAILKVSGLPDTTHSVNVTLTPTDGTLAISTPVMVASGSGTKTVNLTEGVIYGVSSTAIPGYTALYNPQPLTASPNVTETIAYQKAETAGGRVMTYIPGWKTPPSATSLANAGYTHVFVAFGVFSTSEPGKIVSTFDTITPAYIEELHAAGIKVILSLGGALTNLPNTTVDFHQALSKAASPEVFQATFLSSIETWMAQYGFDGIDIDIEHGIKGSGTFIQPTGDIAILANILNKLHADQPTALITLTPQVANVAATSGFDATWGNYASLIMQIYKSLSWVQIQLYNTGCAYGIDQICYAPTISPDFAVAMATNLLENWPSLDPSGRRTGFQPYISYLKPDQVVVGYPAANSSGASDGAPAAVTSTIKKAMQCLRTRTSCDTYVPPHTYPGIGGVFNWEATYDQDNSFKFAKELSACIKEGVC